MEPMHAWKEEHPTHSIISSSVPTGGWAHAQKELKASKVGGKYNVKFLGHNGLDMEAEHWVKCGGGSSMTSLSQ